MAEINLLCLKLDETKTKFNSVDIIHVYLVFSFSKQHKHNEKQTAFKYIYQCNIVSVFLL